MKINENKLINLISEFVCTDYQDGKKCVGITATTDEKFRSLGKDAVIDIVKDDVNLYSNFYWSECSGALEHLYKKYGGIMIPNDYIELFIGNKFETKLKDGYHFSVRFKSSEPDEDDTVINKCIFGFNNRRTYELVKERLDADIRKRVDFIMNSVEESNNMYKRDKYQAAHDVIYVFYDERCDGVNEFSNEMLTILKDSLKTLEDYVIKNSSDTRIDKFETAIWNAHDILDSSTVIDIHKL